MLVNLPNGKTIDMSFEDYLRANIEDYRYLMSQNLGTEMEDPFFGSVLYYLRRHRPEYEDPDDTDDSDELSSDSQESSCEGENFYTDE